MMSEKSAGRDGSNPTDSSEQLRSSILQQLQIDWQRGNAKALPEYLTSDPSLARDDEFLLDLIYTDVLCRDRAGQAVVAEAYLDQYPHLSEAIKRQLLVHRELIDQSSYLDVDSITDSDSMLDVEPKADLFQTSHDTQPRDSVRTESTQGDAERSDNSSQWPSLPGYQLQAELGRGGMGIVYKAQQLQLKRTVAIKMLRNHEHDEGESLDRLRGEAEAIARLQHPNIVQIYSASEYQGSPYLVLEYIDGQNLVSWSQQPLRSVETVVRLIEIVARAVDHAHGQRIVHRDLKPANILLAVNRKESGSSSSNATTSLLDDVTQRWWQPKIADFGLAKQIHSDDQQLTRTQAILGTAAYLSPEQAWGRSRDVGPSTDVHALGIIMVELLTGRSPFQGISLIHTLDNVRFVQPDGPSKLNSRVPQWLDNICARCLAKEPKDRFATALELAESLAQKNDTSNAAVPTLLSRETSHRSLVDSSAEQEKLQAPRLRSVPSRSNRWWFAGTMAVLFCGVAVALVLRRGDNGSTGSNNNRLATTGGPNGTLRKDLVVTAETPPRTVGTNRAFLVGVRNYQLQSEAPADSSNSSEIQLKYTEADVDEMSRVLNRQGFPREHIQLMTQWSQADNPKLAPTADNLRVQLKLFLNSSIEDDTIVIMLTGMGGETQPQGNYFYLPSDAKLNRQSSLISLGELLNMLEPCPARKKLLVIDTCQSVTLHDAEFANSPMPTGVGVLLACSSSQVSLEDDNLRHGVFSHYLLRALEGEGDRNGDGSITLSELVDYTSQHVQSFVATNHPGYQQTPVLIGKLPLMSTLFDLNKH